LFFVKKKSFYGRATYFTNFVNIDMV
jgi:hypothetical protein